MSQIKVKSKRIAKRLLRQETKDRIEALKNLYTQIYNEEKANKLIDKFEETGEVKYAEEAIESELHIKEADSLQPSYDELVERFNRLKGPNKFKNKRNKIKNVAEEFMEKSNKSIEKASKVVLKKRKKRLEKLNDDLIELQYYADAQKEENELKDEIERLKRTIDMQQKIIDTQPKSVKKSSRNNYDAKELENLINKLDEAKMSKDEKKILQMMKNEIENFTEKKIIGCVEKDVAKDTYTENINKRLEDLDAVTHSGNMEPEEVRNLLEKEDQILQRKKRNNEIVKDLDKIKKDIRELVESNNLERIQQQAHRDAMMIHREKMLDMKSNLEKQYVNIARMLDKIGTDVNRRERTIYNLYGLLWIFEDLASVITSLFQFTSAGVRERLQGALNGILNLTKTFLKALLDSLFSLVRHVIGFFSCFGKNSVFVCLVHKFGAIATALVSTSILLLIAYFALGATGILPVLNAVWSFCYQNFTHYASIIGNFLLENIPFIRVAWNTLLSYMTFFVSLLTEGYRISIDFIYEACKYLLKRLWGIVGLISNLLICQVPGSRYIPLIDCDKSAVLEYLNVSWEELAYMWGNFTEASTVVWNNSTIGYKRLEEKEDKCFRKIKF